MIDRRRMTGTFTCSGERREVLDRLEGGIGPHLGEIAVVTSNQQHRTAKLRHGGGDGGRIALRASVDEEQLHLVVEDDGTGIGADLLPQVFTLFAQASRTPDRTQGGLGIGLALVRGLVELHGGSVEAHSDGPGRGARFTVILPLAHPVLDLAPPPAPASTRGARWRR